MRDILEPVANILFIILIGFCLIGFVTWGITKSSMDSEELLKKREVRMFECFEKIEPEWCYKNINN